MNLALAQMAIEPGAITTNRERAIGRIEAAAREGADLVVLPELFTVGYFAFAEYERSAEPVDGETIQALGAVAAENDVAVLAGSIVEDLSASAASGFETPATEGYANTAVFLNRSGDIELVSRKQHLFGYESAEQDLLVPGESVDVVDFEGFTIGTTTCYDLRFPELYRRLVDAGVTLVLVPSAWPYPRVEHWSLLPRARAVENLCYVAGANGVGQFDDAALCGRSAIYDPWGTTVAGIGERAGIVSAPLDPDAVDQRRNDFPALADRRY